MPKQHGTLGAADVLSRPPVLGMIKRRSGGRGVGATWAVNRGEADGEGKEIVVLGSMAEVTKMMGGG